MTAYVYRNDTPLAVAHHQHLSGILDERTIERIVGLRSSLRGLSILEVGAGAGSIAAWLADAVGEGGRVVATDLHPVGIPYMKRLTVLQHDITSEPVPKPPYDLIHARLTLMHLPQRREVLRHLVNALVRGGVVVIEDWDMTWTAGRVLHAPLPADRALFEEFHDALIRVFVDAGAEPGWASAVYGEMVDAGLRDVSAQVFTESWVGGTAGTRLVAGTAQQLREPLLRQGLTDKDLDRVRELMHDRRMTIRMPPLWSTVGWRL